MKSSQIQSVYSDDSNWMKLMSIGRSTVPSSGIVSLMQQTTIGLLTHAKSVS